VLRFAHFRYFSEGELLLRTIAPNLEKALHNCRFMLYGFNRIQEREIECIRKLAQDAGPSSHLTSQASDSQVDGEECRRKLPRRKPCWR
jgi:hypothetical protein